MKKEARNIYEKVTKKLNKQQKLQKSCLYTKILSVEELLNWLDYIDTLNKPIEYIEETLTKELDFS